MHPVHLSDEELLRHCEVTTQRRGGPGGQHRNKVETAVILHHLPTGLVAEANERRSQGDNRRVALSRLRLLLAVEFRSDGPLSQTPGASWLRATVGQRLNVSRHNNALPELLAGLLDWLEVNDYDLPAAADHFAVSSSQLVKLLRLHRPALERVNAQRRQRGLGNLK
jgi:hypothetical protein